MAIKQSVALQGTISTREPNYPHCEPPTILTLGMRHFFGRRSGEVSVEEFNGMSVGEFIQSVIDELSENDSAKTDSLGPALRVVIDIEHRIAVHIDTSWPGWRNAIAAVRSLFPGAQVGAFMPVLDNKSDAWMERELPPLVTEIQTQGLALDFLSPARYIKDLEPNRGAWLADLEINTLRIVRALSDVRLIPFLSCREGGTPANRDGIPWAGIGIDGLVEIAHTLEYEGFTEFAWWDSDDSDDLEATILAMFGEPGEDDDEGEDPPGDDPPTQLDRIEVEILEVDIEIKRLSDSVETLNAKLDTIIEQTKRRGFLGIGRRR